MKRQIVERNDHGPISGPYKDCVPDKSMERARLHPSYGIDYPEEGGGSIDLPGVRSMPGLEGRRHRFSDSLGKP